MSVASSPFTLDAGFGSLRQLAYWLLILVLLVMPLPLGSNRDWAWAPLAAAVGSIVIVHAIGAIGQSRSSVPYGSLAAPGLALAAVIAWGLLQPHLAGLKASGNPIVAHAYQELGLPRASRIALHADDVAASIVMRWLTYAAVFWLVIQLARDSARAKSLLVALAASGVLTTCYGLLAEIAASLKGDFAVLVPKFGIVFSGTFINRNHYATFVGLCALAVMALMRLEAPHLEQEPLRLKVRRLALRFTGRAGFQAAILFLLLGGLVLSNSRGGMAAFLAGMTTFALLGRRRSGVIVAVILVLVALMFALPGGEFLLFRLGWFLNYGEASRTALYELTFNGISLRPWTGWGLGSFEGIYSLLQPATEPDFYERAHNTYLELMLELGIPFGLMLPLGALCIAGRCVIGLRERARNLEFSALAIAATVLVAVHSLVDFSLQLPAVAVLYVALLGIGWAQSWSSRRANPKPGSASSFCSVRLKSTPNHNFRRTTSPESDRRRYKIPSGMRRRFTC